MLPHLRRKTLAGLSLVPVLLAILFSFDGFLYQPSAAGLGRVQTEWLGDLFYRLTSPEGVVLVTSPWLENPDGPVALGEVAHADFILVPNSHHPDFGGYDDMGNPLEVAAISGATVLAPAPLGIWMVENGLPPNQFRRAGGGDRFTLRGLQFTIGPSAHDNTLPTGAAGGPAASYFITFENGFTIFFNGHSTLVADLELYASRFQPDLAILGLMPFSVVEFAETARLISRNNPRLRTIIPSHIRPNAPVVDQARIELDRLSLGHLVFLPESRTVHEFRVS